MTEDLEKKTKAELIEMLAQKDAVLTELSNRFNALQSENKWLGANFTKVIDSLHAISTRKAD